MKLISVSKMSVCKIYALILNFQKTFKNEDQLILLISEKEKKKKSIIKHLIDNLPNIAIVSQEQPRKKLIESESNLLKKLTSNNFNNRFGALVHARMNSSRLPKKAMHSIGDSFVVHEILRRLKCSEIFDEVALCTSENSADDLLAKKIEELGFRVFRGPEENLAARMLYSAENLNLDFVVRITGDDLFRDLHSIKNMLDVLCFEDLDYIYSDDLILGCNSEVFSVDALALINEYAAVSDNTHALTWYLDRPDIFKIKRFSNKCESRPSISLMLDTYQDYLAIKKLWEYDPEFFKSNWSYSDLVGKVKSSDIKFMHHPFDIGLFSRSTDNYNFIFD